MRARAVLALLMLTAWVVPAPVVAAPGFGAEIVGIGPTLPRAGQPVTLTVQVSNPSSADVTDLSARFLISTSPLAGRSVIPDVISGRRLPTYRLVEQSAASGIDLASGVSTTITLQATPRQLGLSGGNPGAYMFGVELQGRVGGRAVTERRVTFLPWQPGAVPNRLGVVTVWTLTAPPSLGVDGIFIDDSLAKAVGADGRLRRQLDAMRAVQGAVWLVDPVLAESVQALAGGARIRTDGEDVRATGDDEMAAAAQWLADLRTAVGTGTLAALPMADLDIRAAAKFGRTTLLRSALAQASARLASVMQVPDTLLVAPLYSGAVTDSTWRFLERVGVNAAVVSDQGYPATQQQYTPSTILTSAPFSGPVLVTDHTTSTTPIMSGLSAVESRQAFAAQLLMTFLERPNDGRVITVAIPPGWAPDPEASIVDVLNAGWVARASFGMASAAGPGDRDSANPVATHGQRLQNVDVARAVDQQRELAHLTGDETFTATVNDAVTNVLSRWFTGRGAADRYSAMTIAQLTALADSVRVITRGEIVFGSERGVVPVTVANGLPVAIDVQLSAAGMPSVRVQPTALTPIHINAGKRVSVEVPTRVTGSGEALLALQIEARDGTVVDGPVLLSVRSAAYARVASYLVAVAFAALLLLVAANTVKRIRNRGVEEVE